MVWKGASWAKDVVRLVEERKVCLANFTSWVRSQILRWWGKVYCWITLKLFQSSAWQEISSMIFSSKSILAKGSMNGSRPIALSQAPNLWFRMGRPRITLCVKKRHDDGKQHANAKHRFHSRMAIGERYCSQWLHKIQHPFRISTFPGLNEYESYHKSRLK